MDEEIWEEPVFQNLHYRWSFAGLYVEHLIAAGLPGVLVFYANVLFGTSLIWFPITFFASAFAILVLQWRKPPEYMKELLQVVTMQKHYTHVVDDSETLPFPISQEDCQ